MVKKTLLASVFGFLIALFSLHIVATASDEGDDAWKREYISTKARLASLEPALAHATMVSSIPNRNRSVLEKAVSDVRELTCERESLKVRLPELEKVVERVERREVEESYLRSLAILKAEAELKALGVTVPPKEGPK